MFRFRSLYVGAMLTLSLFQTSCVDELDQLLSDHPLSEPAKSGVDERLFGQWKTSGVGGSAHWFIGRLRGEDLANAPKGLMVGFATSISKKHELSATDHPEYFFITKLGDDYYLNFAKTKRPDPIGPDEWGKTFVRSYSFAKFVVKNDELTVWPMDSAIAAKAVDDGKLKGIVERDQDNNVQSVRFTDTTENIAQYIQKAGNAAIFSEKASIVFNRVK